MTRPSPSNATSNASAHTGRGWFARLGGALLIAGLLVSPTASFAQGGRPPPTRSGAGQQAPAPVTGKVDLQVLIVHGTDAHDRIDASLKPIMKHLRYLPHKGYTLLSSDHHDIAQGGHHSFPVEGGRRLDAKVLSVDARQAKVRVEMYQGKTRKMETVLAVYRNKAFVISGPKHDGGELILAITPRY